MAKASNVEEVNPGQEVVLHVDLALAHDGTGPALLENWNQAKQDDNGRQVRCEKVLFTMDHAFPAPTVKERAFQKEFEDFSLKQGCSLYKNGEGVLHQVVAEEESIWPGMIIVGADGHVATAGAFGAIAFSVSAEKLVPVLKSGTYTNTVPEQMTISINGSLPPHTLPRDIAFFIIHKLHKEINGKAVALTGSLVNQLSLAGKMSLCNYLPEGGALTAFVLPEREDDEVDVYLDAAEAEPMLAEPPSPTAIIPAKQAAGTQINMAIAGGCSSGRLEDMKIIADVLSGNKVHPSVTFIVTPASRKVLDSMETSGISRIIRDAGAVIMPPGCGSCPGKHFGVLADDDVAITTTIRNSPGRIGSKEAQIYLASPLSVALAALNGKITVP